MTRPLKVLFLTRYPIEGASSRYRVFQYLPHLKAEGIDCTVQSFMDSAMYQLILSKGRTGAKIGATLRAIFRRLAALRKWRRYDAIYMQREMFPFGPPLIERWLKRRGAVLFYDYDDALFIRQSSRYTPLASLLRSPDKARDLFRIVDCTIAGNNWLRDAAEAEGGRAVTVEVAEDTDRIPMHAPHSNEGPVTIGWLGSPTTVGYLHEIAPVLRAIAKAHPNVEWQIMGGGDFAMDGVPWRLSPWSLDGELQALAQFDIGLMPLPAQEWSQGKSGGKARTYMAAGVVPVVAAIGYNLELIKHEETGFLCNSTADWEQHLTQLINDAPLRNRVAMAARADVKARFAPAGQARKLARVIAEHVA